MILTRNILNFLVFLVALSLSSCLYTTHHFNTGQTLPVGKTKATLGVGQHQWNQSSLVKTSVNYRVGVSKGFGPFPGVDLGMHLELPTNPGTMEFDARVGLPPGGWEKLNHSLSVGWGIGMWVDNTLFAEYACSRPVSNHLVFANLRTTYLATQFFEVFQEDLDQPMVHRRRFIYQAGAGVSFLLPELPVVPDVIIPQIAFTYPSIPAGVGTDQLHWVRQVNLNLGMGWSF